MGRKSRAKRKYYYILKGEFAASAGIVGEIGHRVARQTCSKTYPLWLMVRSGIKHPSWEGVPFYDYEVKEFPRGFEPTPAIRKYFRKLGGNLPPSE